MSYRTTRAFERPAATPPPMTAIVLVFGRYFGRMMDSRVIHGLVAALSLGK